jgi:aminocarboxymuconate-semialdehyde decarboxylase
LKIDLHTHILPPKWPDLRERFGYGGWVRLEHHKPCCARMMIDDRSFREIESNCWDPAVRLSECDSCGVDVQVLSTVPVMFSYWAEPEHALDLSRIVNDHIASVVRDRPSRFIGLGTVPMQSPQLAVKEMERCVRDLGLAGIEIGTNVNGRNLDDAGVCEILTAAAEIGAAVFVHPWEMLGRERMGKYWLPWLVGMPAETALAICSVIFCGVLERLPKLRICFAHGGGSFPYTVGRIGHGFNSRPDLCAVDNNINPREYLSRFYVDSLVHDPAALRFLVDSVGENRIAMGSDYPFPLGEARPGQMIESMNEFSDATKRRLLSGTALEFLGLDSSAFARDKSAAPTTARSA